MLLYYLLCLLTHHRFILGDLLILSPNTRYYIHDIAVLVVHDCGGVYFEYDGSLE